MKFWTKKHDVLDFWNASNVMFLDYEKNTFFLGVFGVFFFTKESAILTALKLMILVEVKQLNVLKP